MNIMRCGARLADVPAGQDPRWKAIVTRDRTFDGKFYYSVRSTGVYCRPSCPARPARPENVGFHATRADAERAGLRPCERCKPDRVGASPGVRFAIGKCSLGAILDGALAGHRWGAGRERASLERESQA